MNNEYLKIVGGNALSGSVELAGAKNAVLVIIASLLLTRGVSTLYNVPNISDVHAMIAVMRSLGASVFFNQEACSLVVDTTFINNNTISIELMNAMRASVLVMGPLLATSGSVTLGMPGGCTIGARPIDYHIKNFIKMGVRIDYQEDFIVAQVETLTAQRIVLEYPSVGATENIMMLAVRIPGETTIVNAALEPEVLDLIAVLQKMGADIAVQGPATIIINGNIGQLHSVEHSIVCDRLEAGSLLIAAAATGGSIHLHDISFDMLDVFLLKLTEMGHLIEQGYDGNGIALIATQSPKAVSFKTGPFPGFPTDLQAPMMALQCFAQGTSVIEETVFENRFMHVPYLQKMGAQIEVIHNKAVVTGVKKLQGAKVVATDIRASMALVAAGLAAHGTTTIEAVHHWKRGYNKMEEKLNFLGAVIEFGTIEDNYVQRAIKVKNYPLAQ